MANLNEPVGGKFNKVWVPDGTTDATNGKDNYVEGVSIVGVIAGATFNVDPSTVTPTNRSGSITAGGTAQVMMAANAARNFLHIHNPIRFTGTSEPIWISLLGTAVAEAAGSEVILPGATYETGPVAPNTAVSVLAATTGTRWTAWEA